MIVSIGLPVYNGEQYLERCFESLLAQSYTSFEIILSDNSSSDKTSEICQKYAAIDKRIQYHRQKVNIGAVDNFLFTLSNSKGRYFMWAAYDDLWDSDFIFTLVGLLEINPNCLVAFCSFIRKWEEGRIRDIVKFNENGNCSEGNIVFRKLLQDFPLHNFIYGLYRSEELKKILYRKFPKCIASDRVLIIEFSLIFGFCWSYKSLFQKTISSIPLSVRHKNDDLGQYAKSQLARFYYPLYLFYWIITSSNVTKKRKILSIFPIIQYGVRIYIMNIRKYIVKYMKIFKINYLFERISKKYYKVDIAEEEKVYYI